MPKTKNKEVEKARKAVMKDLKTVTAFAARLEAVDSSSPKFNGLIQKLGDAELSLSADLDGLSEHMRAAEEEEEEA